MIINYSTTKLFAYKNFEFFFYIGTTNNLNNCDPVIMFQKLKMIKGQNIRWPILYTKYTVS